MHWLDFVRYADTCGFHGDNALPAWPYRDYVLNSFRDNKPFDEFTREQLAGDLMPNATREQHVASAFNRLNRTSAEGGLQPKEYLAKYGADRVRTIAAVWMGSTVGCAECHDHKFDPFRSRDFYSMKAFFADIKETGLVPDRGAKAWGTQLAVPSPEQKKRQEELQTQINEAAKAISTPRWRASRRSAPRGKSRCWHATKRAISSGTRSIRSGELQPTARRSRSTTKSPSTILTTTATICTSETNRRAMDSSSPAGPIPITRPTL